MRLIVARQIHNREIRLSSGTMMMICYLCIQSKAVPKNTGGIFTDVYSRSELYIECSSLTSCDGFSHIQSQGSKGIFFWVFKGWNTLDVASKTKRLWTYSIAKTPLHCGNNGKVVIGSTYPHCKTNIGEETGKEAIFKPSSCHNGKTTKNRESQSTPSRLCFRSCRGK